ncbi:MAG: tetratricopeptide repeat protein [Leptolyngbya sp. IPPAS B-1204]|nr:tetratricopeptide repeat protein [Elainella sp. C42_A2020_010]RNJ68071.1 MAG: tetratricopeptide repeat protein [Leptolyngbya sp. IPPAS B-1204]
MRLRLAFLGSLIFFGLWGYWGHDLSSLNSPAEASADATADLPDAASASNVNPKAGLSDNVIEMAFSLASRSRYVDAIALLQTIPVEDENFLRANQLQDLWAETILTLGQAKLKQGKISEAKAILKSIPETTRSYAEAAELLDSGTNPIK